MAQCGAAAALHRLTPVEAPAHAPCSRRLIARLTIPVRLLYCIVFYCSRPITVFRPDKNSFSSQSDDRQPLILRQVDSRGLDLTQQPIVLLFTSIICQKRRVKKA